MLPHIYRSKGFEPFAQFRPVASVAKVASGFFVNKDLPVRTLAEFVAHAKASPKPLNYGSPGVGSNNHLAVERFRKIAGFEATHVPFRGGAPVMAALLAGEIQFAFDAQSTLVPYFKSDSVRVLAFADEARSPFLPGVPTFDESGYPGLYQRSWHTIVAPAGAPDDVVEKLRAAAQRATEGPTARERLTAMQTDPFYHPAAEFEAMARKEYAEAAPSVEAAGLSAE